MMELWEATKRENSECRNLVQIQAREIKQLKQKNTTDSELSQTEVKYYKKKSTINLFKGGFIGLVVGAAVIMYIAK